MTTLLAAHEDGPPKTAPDAHHDAGAKDAPAAGKEAPDHHFLIELHSRVAFKRAGRKGTGKALPGAHAAGKNHVGLYGECTSDGNCNPGLVCKHGSCAHKGKPRGSACVWAHECMGHLVCIAGKCACV